MCTQSAFRLPPAGCAGVSLVESLVALLVLSVGMLGIAGLHVESLKSERTASLRTRAVELATDLSDRMRANRVGAASYPPVAGGTGTNHDCSDDLVGGLTQTCTPQQMAEHDVWLWKKALTNAQTGLPGATGTVSTDGAATPTYVVTIGWEENGEAYSYAATVQLL